MKTEDQQDAIQKVCGWESYNNICCGGHSTAWRCSTPTRFALPPSYPSDLNAMHEAEKTLTENQRVLFRLQLHNNSGGPRATHPTVDAAMCHATAPERAKAFLKTLKLWTAKEAA